MSAFANALSNSVFGSKFLSELQEFTSNATGVVSHILPVTQTKQSAIHQLNDWVYDQINSFSDLEFDYDGYKSLVPTKEIIEQSLSIVELLSEEDYEIFSAAPAPDGSIHITAQKAGYSNSILIEVNNDCTVYSTEDGRYKYITPLSDFRF